MQVTSFDGPEVGTPRWSPDGRRIAFDARVGGNTDVYLVGSDGGRRYRLTADPAEDGRPSWSRDGRWIYFGSDRGARSEVWRIPPEGGAPEQVTTDGGFAAMESPDGRFLYFVKAPGPTGLWRRPAPYERGDQVESVIAAPRLFSWAGWVPVEAGVFYIEESASESGRRHAVRFLSLSTRDVRTVHRLDRVPIVGLTVSPDGRWLAWDEVDHASGDVMLVDGVR